jgi:hypothetical protein
MAAKSKPTKAPAAKAAAPSAKPLVHSCSPIFTSAQCGKQFAIHGKHFDVFGVGTTVTVTLEFLGENGSVRTMKTTGKVISATRIEVDFPKFERDRGSGSGELATTVGNGATTSNTQVQTAAG